MTFRANPHFNDPAFAQAASNIASLFAPPSGADASGWANANATNAKAARLQQYYDYLTSPDYNEAIGDRMGLGVEAYAPSQSFRAVDTQAATLRANNAADNARAIATNRLDNQTKILGTPFGPLNEGQIRPAIPEEFTAALGLPGIGAAAGAPKPLSETELAARERQRLIEAGVITDDMLADDFVGQRTPVQTVDKAGNVAFSSPGAAARTGATPYINKGAEAKPTNGVGVLPDGSHVPAVQVPGETIWRHAQTGVVLPDDVQIFDTPRPQGSAEDVGLTNGVVSSVQKQVMSLEDTLGTVDQLIGLVESSPSSQGIVGMLRGTAQNVIQTGNELGRYMGGAIEEVTRDIENGLTDASLGGVFDPNIPAIDMLSNLLAWQYAKTMGGAGGKVSNEQLRAALAAIGGSGALSNQADTLTRLRQLRDNWSRELDRNRERLGALSPRQTSGGSLAPSTGGGSQRIRFDENGNPI